MIIKILEDNTVYVRYADGTVQTINSTHSHKARNDMVKAVCDAFPYKGAMQFTSDYVPLVFEFDKPGECPEALKTAMGSFYDELVSLKSAKEGEKDKQETATETVTQEQVEVVNGKAVVTKVTKQEERPVFDLLPCVDDRGKEISVTKTQKLPTGDKVETQAPRMMKVPRIKKGVPMSPAAKARLAELVGMV